MGKVSEIDIKTRNEAADSNQELLDLLEKCGLLGGDGYYTIYETKRS
jgi:hypothetical protein